MTINIWYKPRRSWTDTSSAINPAMAGHMESDKDYVLNNLKICVEYLDSIYRKNKEEELTLLK